MPKPPAISVCTIKSAVRLSLFCLTILSAFLHAAETTVLRTQKISPSTIWLLDVEKLTLPERAAACALQGLANRDQLQVFLKFGAASRWMRIDYHLPRADGGPLWKPETAAAFELKYPFVEDYWIDYLTRNQNLTFQSVTLPELIQKIGPRIHGYILYDNLRDDCCVAATAAGLEDALPVTSKLKENLEASGIHLPVILDYLSIRNAFDATQDKRLEAHRWALEHLLPRCRKNGLISRDRTYNLSEHDTLIDLDQAVQNRWFVYDLDHGALENRGSAKLTRNPPDKSLLDTILSRIEPFSPVFGWGRPDEEQFIRTLNRHRLVGICSGVPNNSFFARLPSAQPAFAQKHHLQSADVRVENKVYVAFMVNEGDSLKAANSLMCGASWIQPERGSIPINWGIDPLLVKTHPGLMSYYYATMTTNDYFFAATSGWGYTHPSFLPRESLAGYAALIKQGSAHADVHYVDIWHAGQMEKEGLLYPFLRAAGMAGMTDWDGSQQAVRFPGPDVTIIKGNHYYTLDEPSKFAARLTIEMSGVKPPWFIIVYGATGQGNPYKFSETARRLPADRFKIVALDEFFAAAAKSRTLLEHRVWKPGAGFKSSVP